MNRFEGGAFLALALLAAIYTMATMQTSGPVMNDDSDSYILWVPIRTLGYPIFLSLFGVQNVPVVQPLIYTAALIFLAWEFLKFTKNIYLTIALAALVLVNPEIAKYHPNVATESPFMSLQMVLLALSLGVIREPKSWRIATMAIMMGIMAAIRPTAYAMFPLLVVIVLFVRKRIDSRLWVLVAAAIAPFLVIVGAERLAARAIHGDNLRSLAPYHMFAKSAVIDANSVDETGQSSWVRSRLLKAQEEDFASIRELLKKAPNFDGYMYIEQNYELCLQYACVDAIRDASELPVNEFNMIAMDVALDRIARSKLGFLKLSWSHYRSLWTLYPHRHPGTVAAINQFLAASRPLPFESKLPAYMTSTLTPFWPALLFRPILHAMGVLTMLLSVFALWSSIRPQQDSQIHRVWLAASWSALVVQSCFAFTAISATGVARYTLSMWPAIVACLLLTTFALLSALKLPLGRRRQAKGTV